MTSTVSSSRDSDADSTLSVDAEQYRALCKDIVKKQVFLGQFTDKKFVPCIEDYRDVIVVDASEASLFGRQLGFVSSRLLQTTGADNKKTWIGISLIESATPAEQHWTLWTQLPEGLPFGEYLFKVKTISYKPNEIYLKLKVVYDRDGSENPPSSPAQANIQMEDVINYLGQLGSDVKRGLEKIWSTRHQITVWTVLITAKNCLKYLIAALLIFLAFLFESIPSIGRFALRASHEIRAFIVVLTPIFNGFIRLVNNIFGGFFILLAMIWRDSVNGIAARRQTNNDPPRNMIDNTPHWKRPAWKPDDHNH